MLSLQIKDDVCIKCGLALDNKDVIILNPTPDKAMEAEEQMTLRRKRAKDAKKLKGDKKRSLDQLQLAEEDKHSAKKQKASTKSK